MLQIKKLDIKWNGALKPLDKNKIDAIALHHMAHPSAGPYEIDQWHKNNGWAGFGYGFFIAKDGTIYEGRGFNQNAAVADHNGHIISIGFQGDYENVDKEMPVLQYNAGVDLIRWIMKQIPSIKVVHGHKYWNNTACPGKYFPLDKMIKDAFKDEVEKEQINWQEILRKVADDPSGWEIAINALVLASENGMMNGIYKHLPLLLEKIYNR